ncbi:gluconate permease [Sporosarcina sp. P37]|uniref:GntP family permease n=1 Tax=unclassified Sporosarcina TaxID=2647733 RepID=UPI0009BCA88C|nr:MULTISPECIES: gluconate:H+ symporter [unclassified Sporosarcina]ARD47979.1 gluconate permease [Sporosarcina sp. P33]ARK24503.1 gluconate permease [Sporosarcina sp. P37]PID18378.1 gluconate permease [Sporosarcina sp. P35]
MTPEMQMIVGLVVGVAALIFLVLKTKIHAFLALIIAASLTGLIGGMNPIEVSSTISKGFGSTLGSIGIVVGFGVMIGRILEVSGAAERLAYSLIRAVGKRKEEWAMAIAGYIVSIPIFVDSAFVILNPLVKALSRKTGKSVITLGVALAVGLVATHHAVPPTPGPLGVAGIFGVDIGLMIAWGLVFSIPIVISGVLYAKWVGKRIYQIPTEDGLDFERPDEHMAYQELVRLTDERNKELPSLFRSMIPILLPIVLIFLNTTFVAMDLTGGWIDYLLFLGQPIIAVGLSLVSAIYLLAGHLTREEALGRMEEGMVTAGIILLVTGAGGALGQVLRDSGAGDYIAQQVALLPLPAVLVPFFIATLVRLIQGSGTVAMITAASISAPIVVNLDVNLALAAQAAALGAMIFSYFNDSMFWVVNRMLGVKEVKEQVMVWSIPTTIAWAVSLVSILIANMFVG